jgi:hypothetical protein
MFRKETVKFADTENKGWCQFAGPEKTDYESLIRLADVLAQ